MAMPDLQEYSYTLYQINNVKDNVVSLDWKVINSDNSHLFSCSIENFRRETVNTKFSK